MPYTQPQIKDEINGYPSQPIPLRLVPFITRWPIRLLLEYLSEQFEKPYTLLTAYEYYSNKIPSEVDKDFYADLLTTKTGENLLQKILPNHFIWSEQLVNAYIKHLDHIHDREDWSSYERKLIWNPALGEDASLIHECPDFYKSLPSSLRYSNRVKKKNAKIQERAQRLYNEYLRLKKKDLNLTPHAASKEIAEGSRSEGLGDEAIRKAIRPFTKKLKK